MLSPCERLLLLCLCSVGRWTMDWSSRGVVFCPFCVHPEEEMLDTNFPENKSDGEKDKKRKNIN